jgi:hypothetical protein
MGSRVGKRLVSWLKAIQQCVLGWNLKKPGVALRSSGTEMLRSESSEM